MGVATVPRYGLYMRVSTEEQAKDGYSLDAQRHELVACVKERGGIVVMEERDEGLSGSDWERPGLLALLQGARVGQFERLLCKAPDRLARDQQLLTYLSLELGDHGVSIEYVDEAPGRADPNADLLRGIRAAVAEYETAMTRARIRSALYQRAREGKAPNPVRPKFGYRWNRDLQRLEVDPVEAPVVREIWDRFVVRRQSVKEIYEALNGAGVPSKLGCVWRQSNVRYVLTFKGYYGGFTEYGRQQWRRGHRGQRVVEARPSDEWIRIPIPTILSPEQGAALEARLAETRKFAFRDGMEKRVYMLSGVIFCAHCGQPLQCLQKTKDHHAAYACPSDKRSAPNRCRNRYFTAATTKAAIGVEDVVTGTVQQILTDPTISAEVWRVWAESGASPERRARDDRGLVVTQLGRVDVQLGRLYALAANADMAAEPLQREIAKLVKARHDAEERLRGLDQELRRAGATDVEAARHEQVIAQVRSKLRDLTPIEWRDLLRGLGIKAFAHRDYSLTITGGLPVRVEGVVKGIAFNVTRNRDGTISIEST